MSTVRDCGFELIDHPPYSPDMAPSDYFLFPKMKKHLAGNQHQTDYDVISTVEDFLRSGELLHHRNPSTAAQIDVHGLQRG